MPSLSPRRASSPSRRDRRRRTHQREDSYGDLLPRPRKPRADETEDEGSPSSPSKRRPKDSHRRDSRTPRSARPSDSGQSKSASTALSSAQLAKLDRLNEQRGWDGYEEAPPPPRTRRVRERGLENGEDAPRRIRDRDRERERERRYESADEVPRRRREGRYESADEVPRRKRESRYESADDAPRKRESRLEAAGDAPRKRESRYESADDAPRKRESRYESADEMPRRARYRRQEYREEDAALRGFDDRDERELDRADRERDRRKKEQRERKRREREAERMAEEKAAALVGAAAGYEHLRNSDRRKERRVVSGQVLERGEDDYDEKDALRADVRRRDGSNSSDADFGVKQPKWKNKKNICIGVVVLILLLIIIIPVAVVVSKKKSSNSDSSSSSQPSNGNLKGISPSSIPQWAQGGYLDPFDWYTTLDFNITFTDQTVGGLYVMGLNSTWDDNTQANSEVPKLNEQWQYGSLPMRGINLGGWLSIEPFIAPSLFDNFQTSDNVVDEWTLSAALGQTQAKSTLEQHYATWISEDDFANIAAAGFDHVRIPYSYWAVKTYEGDPYVPLVSWRYLLRGIEWARKYGLRINLDLHGLPGSQNGMNHSGHQGLINWLNGTNGTMNGDRSIEIHNQLTQFFAQDRYKNIIALYGLANEPRMTYLDATTVLDWSQRAISLARANNYQNLIVVGDGFYGLDKWHGQLQDPKVVLDAHQYVIFNTGQIVFNHSEKLNYACAGWTSQAKESVNTNTGFGPTIFGEWSQADTDCANYLNNVGVGSRWEGTLNFLDAPGGQEYGAAINSVLTPTCPTNNNPRCDCSPANADPSTYSSTYKQWLLNFAEAQMYSFEFGWGWYYWTWKTETASQWSYQAGLAGGYMPTNARSRSWNCSMPMPSYSASNLPEYY